jgi:predicted RNA methylase
MVDECYFAGYSKSSIHKDMLNDLVRIEQYTEAVNDTCKDKVVLDIGCGTGVLSVFAIKAGATKVYAIDNADSEKLMSSEFK